MSLAKAIIWTVQKHAVRVTASALIFPTVVCHTKKAFCPGISARSAAGSDNFMGLRKRGGATHQGAINAVKQMTPPFDASPVSHLFVFLTLLFSLRWQKLQPKSYMWSFYSNPVASMSSSVNFPIGCLTKQEKTKSKKKERVGIMLTLRGWGPCLRLISICSMTVADKLSAEINVFDQFSERLFHFEMSEQRKTTSVITGRLEKVFWTAASDDCARHLFHGCSRRGGSK